MNRLLPWIAVLAGSLVGCTGGPGTEGERGDGVAAQTEFDLTIADDRALFEERDLGYRSSIGPYAVYEVTGDSPRLQGPRVYFWDREGGGFAMLCSTLSYFTNVPGAPRIRVVLLGGRDGDTEIVGSHENAIQFAGITAPGDDFGERIPRDPADDDPAQDDPQAGGDPDSPMTDDVPEADMVEPMAIEIDPAPPVGSLVLLRRVALSGVQMGHNDSHVIPNVSCTYAGCALQ